MTCRVNMKKLFAIALLFLATSFVSALAQPYPLRPITIIVGTPPGSLLDIFARGWATG